MTIVIQNQLEALERSADVLETLARQKPEFGSEVEDLIHSLLSLWEEMDHYCQRRQSEIDVEPAKYVVAEANAFHSLFVRLSKLFDRALTMGRQAETLGYELDQKQAFLVARRKLHSMAVFSPEHVEQARQEFSAGKGTTLKELELELRGDLQQPRRR